ncbi:hypothetical protein DIR46_07005 [Massilia oculi]|uniref:Uncharacterized protein n=1 Tax=Massilia oculi TaxID=945844 RepID=A0A2S2DGK1_9BURK|nr:hypothetical protein DIR46_07005 [Massilia oculi]
MDGNLPSEYKILVHTALAQTKGHIGFFSIHAPTSRWDGPDPIFVEIADQASACSSIVVAMREAYLRAWDWINTR